MSDVTQPVNDLVHLVSGGGGAVGGATGFYLLQRLMSNGNGNKDDIAKIVETSTMNSSKLESIDNGIHELNVTMAEIKGALARG